MAQRRKTNPLKSVRLECGHKALFARAAAPVVVYCWTCRANVQPVKRHKLGSVARIAGRRQSRPAHHRPRVRR